MNDKVRSQIKKATSFIIERSLEGYTINEQNDARNLLLFLFPRLDDIFDDRITHHSRSEVDLWAKEKRATSMEYFDRYFAYAIPRGDIKDQEIDAFISKINGIESLEKVPYNDISSVMQRLIAEGAPSLFLEKLGRRVDKLSPVASYIVARLVAMARNIFPDTDMVYNDPVGNFVYERIKGIKDKDLRFELAKAIAQLAEPISFVFDCFKYECDCKNGKQSSPFSSEEKKELCEVIVNRIKALAKLRPIYIQYPKYAPFFFRIWLCMGSRDEINNYIKETLDADSRNVSDLLKSYLLRGQGESDIPLFEFSEDEYHRMKEVIDTKIIYDTVLKVYPHIVEPYDQRVKISSEEETARLFIGIHDQNNASSINSQN